MRTSYLITKYGEQVYQNGREVIAYVDEERTSFYKNEPGFGQYTGLSLAVLFVRDSDVAETDIFLVENRKWRVFEAKEMRVRGSRVYTEVVVYEDDFVHKISIQKQRLNIKECNLPSLRNNDILLLQARIEDKVASDYLQYSMHSKDRATHTISIIWEDGKGLEFLEIADLVVWGEKHFEILGIENVNEKNKLILLTVRTVV